MLAGATRLVEICFVIPSIESSAPSVDSDRHSDRTIALDNPAQENPRIAIVHAFRHLPPFVSPLRNGMSFQAFSDSFYASFSSLQDSCLCRQPTRS